MLTLPTLPRTTLPIVNAEFLATQLRVLSEPHRLQIVGLLRESERCVCEIESALGLSQSLVSNHLRVLRQAGLVVARRDDRDARWIYYRLDRVVVNALRAELSRLLDLSRLDPSPTRCTPDGRPVRD